MVKQDFLGLQRLLALRGVWAVLAVFVVGAMLTSDATASAGDQNTADWMTNFDEAEAAAKKAGLPMVVHFWAPWCGPCRNMEAEVLSSQNVKAMLGEGIIGVKVNSDENKNLVSRFGVTALPTDVFVSPDGKVQSRSVGSPGLQGYLAKLGQYRAAQPAPVVPSRPLEQAVAKTEEPKVQTVTAAKPVIEDVAETEKPIVGLNAATEESKDATVAASDTKPAADAPATTPSLPVAKNKALRKDEGHRLGLNGYSPVLLTDGTKWQKGDPQFSHNFQGVQYRLTSAEELEKFKASPEKFIPALHGCDPVSLVKDQTVTSGFVELGASFRSRMYFFTSKASRDEFLKSPEKFASAYNLAFFEAEDTAASTPNAADAASQPAAEPTATEPAAEPAPTGDASTPEAAPAVNAEPAPASN
ncbi:MAG: thioredoxin domain-containing protein [Planctomycetota bacterium]